MYGCGVFRRLLIPDGEACHWTSDGPLYQAGLDAGHRIAECEGLLSKTSCSGDFVRRGGGGKAELVGGVDLAVTIQLHRVVPESVFESWEKYWVMSLDILRFRFMQA
jgi:hypothetical protein